MNKLGKIIYQQFYGNMQQVAIPKNPLNSNFVIMWRGFDWSGFRTLQKCIDQFPELEARQNCMEDNFSIVERL